MSATTSSYTSQCVHDFVPANADLVLIEFSVNDWEAGTAAAWMNNSQRRVPNEARSQSKALPDSVSAHCVWADKDALCGVCICLGAAVCASERPGVGLSKDALIDRASVHGRFLVTKIWLVCAQAWV